MQTIAKHLIHVGTTILAIACADFAVAQSPFAPPPPPQVAPSAVRGLYDSREQGSSFEALGASQNSAATAIPVQSPASAIEIDPSVTPTPSDLGSAKPLEGGEIVARIDGEIVLASDVLWQVNLIIEANRGRIPPDQLAEAQRMLLRQQVMGLIDTKVLYADFRRKIPAENLPKIEENLLEPFEESEIPRLVEMLKVPNRRAMEEMLEQHGSALSDVRRQFIERTIAGEWLRQLAPKPKPVTHDQMLVYYKAHEAEYDFPSQATWEELMVRFDRCNGDRNAAWKQISEMGNEVWQRVAANPKLRGAAFGEVAKARSHGITAGEGGTHKLTNRGALRSSEIDTALFSLQVGQLSNVIETEQGFHIVRVLERQEAGRTPFTDAQADIRKILEAEAKKDGSGEELKKLRDKSRIWTVFDGEFRGSDIARLSGQGQLK